MEQPTGREPVADSQAPNPAKYFASWDSTNKQFVYWDKTNKCNVEIKLPFAFIPLYKMVTLKGYNHKEGKSYWSNEVKDLSKEKFILKSKNNATKEIRTEFVGLYSDIKTMLDGKANYTESLYIGVKGANGQLELANLQISTSALKPWINFIKNNDISKIAVQVASFTNEKNGAVNFTSPVYTPLPITPKSDAEAVALQQEIKAYLAEYLSANAVKAENENQTEFKSPEPAYEAPDLSKNSFQTNVQVSPGVSAPIVGGNPFGVESKENPWEDSAPPF